MKNPNCPRPASNDATLLALTTALEGIASRLDLILTELKNVKAVNHLHINSSASISPQELLAIANRVKQMERK